MGFGEGTIFRKMLAMPLPQVVGPKFRGSCTLPLSLTLNSQAFLFIVLYLLFSGSLDDEALTLYIPLLVGLEILPDCHPVPI